MEQENGAYRMPRDYFAFGGTKLSGETCEKLTAFSKKKSILWRVALAVLLRSQFSGSLG